MSDTSNAFRAGLVIIIGAVVGLSFFFASRKNNLSDANSVAYYALLTDASGLNAKSLITVAGLQVGEIRDIRLVEVKYGELVADLNLRARKLLGLLAKDEPEATKNSELDGVVRLLIDEGKIKTLDDVPAIADEITKIARVDMRIVNNVDIPVDSWLKKDALGLLGSKALFLELGPSKAVLPSNGRVVNVRSVTATDDLLNQATGIIADVKSITHKIDEDLGGIVKDVHGITGELNRFVSGDENTKPLSEIYAMVMSDLRKTAGTIEKAVRDVDSMLNANNESVTAMLSNIKRISGDIADLTSGSGGGGDGGPGGDGEEGDLRATMSKVRQIADDMSVVTTQLKGIMGENEDELGDGVKDLRVTIKELNSSLASLSEVTGRISKGEGTVGRLLTDEALADKVEGAVAGASDFVAGLTSLEAHVDLGTYYNFLRAGTTTTVGFRLQPKPDKYYLIELTDDGGGLEQLTRTFTGAGDVGANKPATDLRQTVYTRDNSLRITAMFAKRFFDFLVVRAGLVEGSGGLGANLFLFDDRVELRSDVFNFGGPRFTTTPDPLQPEFYLPRWRSYIKAQPIPFLYVMGGVDDVLNFGAHPATQGYGIDYFVGAGITFKDEDLRSILPFIPSF